jgi:hypothetical protein
VEDTKTVDLTFKYIDLNVDCVVLTNEITSDIAADTSAISFSQIDIHKWNSSVTKTEQSINNKIGFNTSLQDPDGTRTKDTYSDTGTWSTTPAASIYSPLSKEEHYIMVLSNPLKQTIAASDSTFIEVRYPYINQSLTLVPKKYSSNSRIYSKN